MPARNTIRDYSDESYYHVYNRGVAKQPVFVDEQDNKVFLNYLKEAMSPPIEKDKVDFTLQGQTFKGTPRFIKNFHKEIELVAYCLIPNHFHLLFMQKNYNSISRLMQSLITRYCIFFNKKYKRVGPVFQGRYKAILIKEENYLLHLSRYIHLNPHEYTKDLTKAYSSYANYVGLWNTSWVKPDVILSYFAKSENQAIKNLNSYKSFVEDYKVDSGLVLGHYALEEI